MLESDVERAFNRLAKERGWVTLKFLGNRGYPDRILLRYPAKVLWVELKRPRKGPRKLQEKKIEKLKKMGFSVYVIDNIETAKTIL